MLVSETKHSYDQKMKIINFLKELIPSSFKTNLRYRLGVPSQQKSFYNLKRLGFIPETVLDIGAYNGIWATELKKTFPAAQILMLEGQNAKKQILENVCRENKGIDYQIALLGASEKRVIFNIYDSASSILEENNKTGALVEERTLSCLDKLLADTDFSKPDLIKLDTQGYELEILKGGEKTLKNAQAVLMEVSMIDIYKECPLVADVIVFMADRDFALYDICSLMRRPLDSALFQSDFLFVKRSSTLRTNKRWI